jgi:hypothetical protein
VLLLLSVVLPHRIAPAATLSGSFASFPSGTNVNLSTEGTLDWADWGLVNEWSFNHKYGVAQQITYSFTTDQYFTDGPYLLESGPIAFNWTDGTPTRMASSTTNGTSIFGDKFPGNTPAGFQIQCPADTSPKRLKVYVGTSGSQATFSASLSGASSYSDNSFNGSTVPLNGVYTLNFQAGSAGQTLTVTFTSTDGSGYMILKAATLSGTNSPPTASIASPPDGTVLSAPATFTVTATAADNDGTVTNLVLQSNGAQLARSASAALSLTLTNRPSGAYSFCAVATDNYGLSITSFPAKVYVLTNGGILSGSTGAPPLSLNLTAEGTCDWAHWGLSSPSSFDHKSGVVQKIPNVVLLNAASSDLNSYTDNLTAFSWSDGTPTAQVAGSTTGIFLYATNTPAAGFQLTVPATNVLRRLNVYVGLYAAQGRLDAALSDYSALPYSDSSLSKTYVNGYALYTLYFASPTPGASLVVTWAPVQTFDSFYGNLTWQAATLWQQPPQPLLWVVNPPPGSAQFALSFYAQTGVNYTVQFLDALGTTNWQVLTNFPGAGGNALVADPQIGPGQRFYRVIAQ